MEKTEWKEFFLSKGWRALQAWSETQCKDLQDQMCDLPYPLIQEDYLSLQIRRQTLMNLFDEQNQDEVMMKCQTN